jgi:hypothetical protein
VSLAIEGVNVLKRLYTGRENPKSESMPLTNAVFFSTDFDGLEETVGEFHGTSVEPLMHPKANKSNLIHMNQFTLKYL